jgi:hypothetical protein
MSHKDLAERASRMAIPSSGDDAADQNALLDAALHQARMDENVCPNSLFPNHERSTVCKTYRRNSQTEQAS